MIGKIYSIEENYVFVDLAIDISTQENLINVHVVFEDGANRIVGEIKKIDKTVAKIGIVGEILEDKFITGINKKPSFRSKIRIINLEELYMVLGNQKVVDKIQSVFHI